MGADSSSPLVPKRLRSTALLSSTTMTGNDSRERNALIKHAALDLRSEDLLAVGC